MKKILLAVIAVIMLIAVTSCQIGDHDDQYLHPQTKKNADDTENGESEEDDVIFKLIDTANAHIVSDYESQFPDTDISMYKEYLTNTLTVGKEKATYVVVNKMEMDDGITHIEFDGMTGFYMWDYDNITFKLAVIPGKMWTVNKDMYFGENAKEAAEERYLECITYLTNHKMNIDDADISEIDGGYVVTMAPSASLTELEWDKCQINFSCDQELKTYRPLTYTTTDYYENGNIKTREILTFDEEMNTTSSSYSFDEAGNQLN